MVAKIKKGDRVLVMAGRDKGKAGEVLAVFPSEDRALVQGVNMVRRHQSSQPSRKAALSAAKAKFICPILRLPTPRTARQRGLACGWQMTARKCGLQSVQEK